MATIYSLETGGVVWYVGSTTDTKRRLKAHRNKESRASKEIGDYDIEFHILEECDIETRYERERHYYETLKPLYNIQHPGLSKEEVVAGWNHRNPDRARQMRLDWARRNPDKVREAQQRYNAKRKATQSLPT